VGFTNDPSAERASVAAWTGWTSVLIGYFDTHPCSETTFSNSCLNRKKLIIVRKNDKNRLVVEDAP
jgi:hypothetical protein